MNQVQTFRPTLTPGDPLRDWTLVWSRQGLPSGLAALGRSSASLLLNESYPARNGLAQPYCHVLRLPQSHVGEGEWQLYFGAEACGRLTVTDTAAPRPSHAVPAGDSASLVNVLMAAGVNADLAPGRHVWDRAVNLFGGTIRGYGAVIERIPDGDYGERVFRGSGTLIGLTMKPHHLLFHGDGHGGRHGLVAKGCTFLSSDVPGGGDLGWGHEEVLFLDCTFDGLGNTSAPHGLYLRCRFLRNNAGHGFCAQGTCLGKLAMVDCEFDGTDRGPVFQLRHGSINDNLFVGTVCKNIQRDMNGNEMLCPEGGGVNREFSRNLVVNTRVSNCDGSIQLFEGPCRDNLFLDTVQTGGGGFWLAGVLDHEQTGNVFEQFELRDTLGILLGWQDATGRIHGQGVRDNVFRKGAILGWRPSRLNQGDHQPRYYAPRAAAMALDPAFGLVNHLEDVDFVSLKQPWANLSAVNCRHDGVPCGDVEVTTTTL